MYFLYRSKLFQFCWVDTLYKVYTYIQYIELIQYGNEIKYTEQSKYDEQTKLSEKLIWQRVK